MGPFLGESSTPIRASSRTTRQSDVLLIDVLLDFGMTVRTKEITLGCFQGEELDVPVGTMAQVQREGFCARIAVMKGQGAKATVITTAFAFPSFRKKKLILPLKAALLLVGVVGIRLASIFTPEGAKDPAPPRQHGGAYDTLQHCNYLPVELEAYRFSRQFGRSEQLLCRASFCRYSRLPHPLPVGQDGRATWCVTSIRAGF